MSDIVEVDKEPLVKELSVKEPLVKTPSVKRGRPKKADVLAKKKGNRGTVGRPVGDAGRLQEFKARLLAAPTANKIIDKILEVAYTDGHPGQMAALKLCAERIIPISAFEKDVNGNKPQINIMITGLQNPSIQSSDDVIDMEES